jgi:thiamine biosynthesis protein ThiI
VNALPHANADLSRRVVLVHYAEVGLKRGRRHSFERRLQDRLREGLASADLDAGVAHLRGRLVAHVSSPEELSRAMAVVTRIPGVANASAAYVVASEMEAIGEAAATALAEAPAGSFKVETRRADKAFPKTSIEVSQTVAPVCLRRSPREVDVRDPDITVRIEITKQETYVSAAKVPGPGGLPVGSTSRLLSLLSGGIDSAVASWLMIRRGARVTAAHFHNLTHEGTAVLDKLKDVCGVLAWSSGRVPLLVVPFEDCQRAIVGLVPAEYRMIVYRRAMFRIGATLARNERALGFVTGDSLGQVASQTAENIRTIHAAATLPVYAPLAGSDKTEIMERARAIGTYDISIRPHDDCCSFLVAPHPVTTSRLEDVAAFEEALDWDDLVGAAVEGTKRIVHLPDPAALDA